MPTHAIGDALSGVSSKLMRMSEMQAQANDARQALEADKAVQKMQMDFQAWKAKTPDESQWAEEWKRQRGELEGVIGKMRMTDDARAQLNQGLQRQFAHAEISLQGEALKQTGLRTRATAFEAVSTAVQGGNAAGAEKAVSTLQASGAAADWEIADLRRQIATEVPVSRRRIAVEKSTSLMNEGKYDEAYAALPEDLDDEQRVALTGRIEHHKMVSGMKDLAQEDPIAAQKIVSSARQQRRITPLEEQEIKTLMDTQTNVLRTQEMKELQKAIENPAGRKTEQISLMLQEKRYLQDDDKQMLSRYLHEGNQGDFIDYLGLFGQVATFSGQKDTPEYKRLLMRVNMMTKDEKKAQLLKSLDYNATHGPDDAHRVADKAYGQLTRDAAMGKLAGVNGLMAPLKDPTTQPEAAVRDAINTIYQRKLKANGWENVREVRGMRIRIDALREEAKREYWQSRNDQRSSYETYKVRDENRRLQTEKIYNELRTEIADFLKANPKATSTDVKRFYDGALGRRGLAFDPRYTPNVPDEPTLPSSIRTAR